jgi:hypothetical protein
LLSGGYPAPDWAQGLIKTLEQCTGLPGGRKWVDDAPTPEAEYPGSSVRGGEYAFAGVGSPGSVTPRQSPGLLSRRRKAASVAFPPSSWGSPKPDGSYFGDQVDEYGNYAKSEPAHSRNNSREITEGLRGLSQANSSAQGSNPAPATFGTHFESDFIPDEQAKQHPHFTSSSTASRPSLESSGSHPSIAAVGHTLNASGFNSSYPIASHSTATGDLLNLGGNDKSSPLDFDPLGSTSQARPGYSSSYRSSSNPFFDSSARHTPSPSLTSSSLDYVGSPVQMMPSQARTTSYAASPLNPYSGQPNQRSSVHEDLYGSSGNVEGSRTSASPGPQIRLRPELAQPLPSYAVGRAIALYDFAAGQEGDLSFKEGQVIDIIEKSQTTNTWYVRHVT